MNLIVDLRCIHYNATQIDKTFLLYSSPNSNIQWQNNFFNSGLVSNKYSKHSNLSSFSNKLADFCC